MDSFGCKKFRAILDPAANLFLTLFHREREIELCRACIYLLDLSR